MTETVEQAVDRYWHLQRVQVLLQAPDVADPWLDHIEDLMDAIWWSRGDVRERLMEEALRGD